MAAGQVHLCRASPCGCTTEADYHITCFAAVDPDVNEVVDRGAYRWTVGRLAAFLYHALVGLPWNVVSYLCCFCCCCTRCARPKGPTDLARRSAESESETEDERDPCAAHKVSWEGDAGLERLTNRGLCQELGAETATLLIEDMRASDSPVDLKLCSRHRASYFDERWCKRCPHDGCQHLGALKVKGLRLCQDRTGAHHPDQGDARSGGLVGVPRRARPRGQTRPSPEAQGPRPDQGQRRGRRAGHRSEQHPLPQRAHLAAHGPAVEPPPRRNACGPPAQGLGL
jgi:hypothetical protein